MLSVLVVFLISLIPVSVAQDEEQKRLEDQEKDRLKEAKDVQKERLKAVRINQDELLKERNFAELKKERLNRIKELKDEEIAKLKVLEKEKLDRDKKYTDAVAKADAAFRAKTYSGARTLYQSSSAVKPGQTSTSRSA